MKYWFDLQLNLSYFARDLLLNYYLNLVLKFELFLRKITISSYFKAIFFAISSHSRITTPSIVTILSPVLIPNF